MEMEMETTKRIISKGTASPLGGILEASKAIHAAIHDELRLSMSAGLKSFESDLMLRVGAMFEKELNRRVTPTMKEMEDRMIALEKSYENGMKQVQSILKALPTPIVNLSVPENAIQVKQLPVQFNVPENAIQVKMEPSQVVVPENAFNVSLHKEKSRKVVEKSILYNTGTGRPEKIIEQTTEE